MKKRTKIFLIVAGAVLAWLTIFFGTLFFLRETARGSGYRITKDPAQYRDVIGSEAKGQYRIKWGMSEEIFPETVEGLDVEDFRMVYYDPWDKQFLCRLVVDYDEAAYEEESRRLAACGIDEYVGYYGVTGFTKYSLLAMEADPYYGFVYAITDGKSRIIYVETIFCNWFYDIAYERQIPGEYLPDGFNAKPGNPYRKEMLRLMREEEQSGALSGA